MCGNEKYRRQSLRPYTRGGDVRSGEVDFEDALCVSCVGQIGAEDWSGVKERGKETGRWGRGFVVIVRIVVFVVENAN